MTTTKTVISTGQGPILPLIHPLWFIIESLSLRRGPPDLAMRAVCGGSGAIRESRDEAAVPFVAGFVTLRNHLRTPLCSPCAPADLSPMSFMPFIIGHSDIDSLPICMCCIICCIIPSSIWAFRASMAIRCSTI
jgi:hypothetical protein